MRLVHLPFGCGLAAAPQGSAAVLFLTEAGMRKRASSRIYGLVFGLLLAGTRIGCAHDGWQVWATLWDGLPLDGIYVKMALDNGSIYYSTLHEGVLRASMQDRAFDPVSRVGLPLLLNYNPNSVFDLWFITVTPQHRLVAGFNPARFNGSTNTTPLIYYYDEAADRWFPSSVSGRAHPYTASMADFALGPDGALWTCTGWSPYVYRSEDGGVSFVALNINTRVPTNYFPIPGSGQATFGRLFGIFVTPSNEVILGTETGGFLHSYDHGETWTSLAPDFTDTNSVNPLGRTGNAKIAGLDRFGNVLCVTPKFFAFPDSDSWYDCRMMTYRPSDAAYGRADDGIEAGNSSPFRVVTTSAGESFISTTYLTNGVGGLFRSRTGRTWSRFNDGIPTLAVTGLPAMVSADSLAVTGTLALVGYDNQIWYYDTAPAPASNHPPVAFPQDVVTRSNQAASLTLSAQDEDGNGLTYVITQHPLHGSLSGSPPILTYVPSNRYAGLDALSFTALDGVATSAPARVLIAVNGVTSGPPAVALLGVRDRLWHLASSNLLLAAEASDPAGLASVSFYINTQRLAVVSNAPYGVTWTNPAPGRQVVSALAVNSAGARRWSRPAVVEVVEAPPELSLRTDEGQAVVTWPLALDGFLLEARTHLTDLWQLVPTPPLDEAFSRHAVTIPGEEAAFFRLWHP
jgi:hypothetical protein